MYMLFEDNIFRGLYATYEDAINPHVNPIINADGTRGMPHPKVEAEKYPGYDHFSNIWDVKPAHEPHRI
ncbi:hypothetical protein SEA_GIBBLES_53 [Gordonia phage Gibbles]|uniref:Uncharacterized protein n=3 Tax=Gordonia phage Orchid TaxID=1838075 RepID=A0A160DH62_9CAUD|nr:hypothetical protein BH761_gp054 [Gordonia phage Orchid]ANA87289.1 hypothetical protein PBI_PATRICKSTAR_55 [Gordonia phage PatrickStar]ANA87516.1 hypothetical protein PBI_KAMPE_55 [Gordonia phage Kampe]AXH46506.1 hypothetical protein SEA_ROBINSPARKLES_58 [Gordonia phage RobinSparkles]QDK02012.1 hypothetical protein SEA_GIBBLES_53 [Gordonia phage Gibbles]ANA87401.1 hypothetical protein PBI_ORCHID_54 [Gordonia phage Orchid]